jgi:PAS domain S-box-containing protein
MALEGFIQDVTDRHQETLRAQESEARYRGLFEDAPVAFWEEDFSAAVSALRELTRRGIADVDEWLRAHPDELSAMIDSVRVLDINSAGLRMFGSMNKNDVLGSLGRTMPKDAHQRFIAQLISLADGVTTFSWEGPAGTAESRPIYVTMQLSALPGHEHTCDRVLMSMVDITERRETEQKLLESERRYRELAGSLPQVVYETDTNGRLLFGNSIGLGMFGYGAEDLAGGVNVLDLLIPGDRERARTAMAAIIRSGKPGGGEYNALRRDGSAFPVLVHSTAVNRDGIVCGTRGIMIDMTQQQSVEERQRQADKLESLGILAGGIAHDFNNILTGIAGNINLARLEDDREQARDLLREAEQETIAARSLSQQLLTFARGGAPVRTSERLQPILEESAGFALRGSIVHAAFAIDPALWTADIDKAQMAQVISNIVINAREAMPGGGTVTIQACNVVLHEDDVPGLVAGTYARIDIGDTGIGIPESDLHKVFDPYFSTKQRGSGLGLATAHTVVQKHGGCILVRSVLGQGTTFTIYLPANLSREQTNTREKLAAATGHGRVLVMDDEPSICRVATAMLRRLGYDAESVSNGDRAIETVTAAMREHRPFDILIMDLTIAGGMGGSQALALLRSQGCSATAIASSGYSTDAVMADHKAYQFDGILVKPYNMEELAAALAVRRPS